LAQIEGQLRQNYQEALDNQARFKTLFSSSKSSYDDDLTGFEDEQNINTSFMLKDDLEGKKKGMIQLGQELGKQKDYLMNDRNQVYGKLMRLNEEWMQMYPGETPLYVQPQQAPVQQPPQAPEEMAARKAFFDKDKPMMPDGMRDGTGREAIPV